MKLKNKRLEGRLKRKRSIRKKIKGTPQCPRLTVFKSLKYIYAQAVDDIGGVTIAAESTLSKKTGDTLKSANSFQAAELLGETIAEDIAKKGIKKVVFDRNGYLYHGKIKALADKVREKGIEF